MDYVTSINAPFFKNANTWSCKLKKKRGVTKAVTNVVNGRTNAYHKVS